MSYPAVEADWPICKTAEADAGFEPDADVYVVQLTLIKPPIRRWHAKGKGVFVWLDDAFWMMPIRSKPQETWSRAWPDVCEWLGEVDGIIVPSRVLAQDMLEYNPNVCFIPNYHRFFDGISRQWPKGDNLIGYGGSYYHWASWRDTRCWEVLPGRAWCNIVGMPMLASMIEHYRKDLRVQRSDLQKPDDYLMLVGHWKWQPIPCHGEYDRRRSWIKALESLFVGTAWTGFGNAVEDVYGAVPELVQGRDPTEAMEWARRQHIRYHLDEWKGVLCV